MGGADGPRPFSDLQGEHALRRVPRPEDLAFKLNAALVVPRASELG